MIRARPQGIAAIVLVFFVAILLFPLLMMLLNRSVFLNKSTAQQKINRSNDKANEAMINDFMSQFTKGIGYYEDHYAPAFVNRTEKIFQKSSANVTVTANRGQRTLLIRSTGTLNSDATNSKGLEVLIKFVPLIGIYGRHMGGDFKNKFPLGFTCIYKGPVRADGNLTNEGSGNIIFESFVVVGGIADNSNTTVFEKELYYGESIDPPPGDPIYQGGVFHTTIPGNLVPINADFYEMFATTEAPAGTSVWWKFRANNGISDVSEYQFALDTNGDHEFTAADTTLTWSPWLTIPPGGGIFLGRNSKSFVSGVVRGAVTVVSLCPPGCNQAVKGTIEITCEPASDPCQFAYASGVESDGNNGIFLLSSHGFYMTNPSDTEMNISGCIYSDDPLVNPGDFAGWIAKKPDSNIPNTYTFNGSMNNVDGKTDFNPTIETYDPKLQDVSAIGIPERPIIVHWRHTN